MCAAVALHATCECLVGGFRAEQAIGGQEPELGYPSLAQLLRRAGVTDQDQNLRDMRELFRRMVFNILIDNTDDHEKNHALQVVAPTRQGRYRLAPAYDVLTTNSGQGYQEFVVGTDQRDSTLSNAMSQCDLFGYTPAQAAAEVPLPGSELLIESDEQPAARPILGGEFPDAGRGTQQVAAV